MAKRRYANDLYRIESTQSGDEIEFCKTFREAMATLKKYEKMDTAYKSKGKAEPRRDMLNEKSHNYVYSIVAMELV